MSTYGLLRAPRETIFGPGTLATLGGVASRIGARACLVIDARLGADLRERTEGYLREAGVEVVTTSIEPGPVGSADQLAEILPRLRDHRAELIVALGGGSILDLAKLVSVVAAWGGSLSDYTGELRVPGRCLPVVGIPTTAGTGSEVSPVSIVMDPTADFKVVVSSPWTIPVAAIVDPELTLSCPRSVTIHAGVDALANAIESYTAAVRIDRAADLEDRVFVGAGVLSADFGLEAAGLVARYLPRAAADGQDLEARSATLLGSLKAGLAYSQSGTAAVHALNYPIEGRLHIPHGLGVGVLLPFVMAWTRPARVPELARLAVSMGADQFGNDEAGLATEAVQIVTRLNATLGIPGSLDELGVPRDDLPALASQAASVARLVQNNGRPASPADLLDILEAAWHGDAGRLDRGGNALTSSAVR